MKSNISDPVLEHVILKKNEKNISSNEAIMHTRIIDYINDFRSYIIEALSLEPFRRVLDSNEQDIYMIVPNLILIHQKGALLELLNRYYFVELFELSNCFIRDNELKYMFWHMRKARPTNVRISVCKIEPHPYVDRIWDPEHGRIRLPESYYPRYAEYLSKLDKWVKEGIEPDNSDYYEYFRTIPYDEFDNRFINPRLYFEGLDDLRKKINRSNFILLSDIADIIHVSQITGSNKTYTIDINRKSLYPFDPEFGVVEDYGETQKLQAGDLLVWNSNNTIIRCFLFEKEADFPIFAPANTSIIRLKSDVISPEYLYLYFFNEIGLDILYHYRVEVGNHFKDISIELSNVPVAMPARDKNYYEDVFNKIAYPKKRYYGKFGIECGNSISALLEKKWADCLYIKNSALLETQMEADIKEIGVCIENRAYKATTLLIGSLLEAYIIDWVSEIDGVDYYQDGKKYDNNFKYGLSDYIDYLSDYSKINYKSLYNEYRKKHSTRVWSDAHYLRKYRNKIHMKVHLEKYEQLNKEKCSMLLGKLESIFEFRRKTLENR